MWLSFALIVASVWSVVSGSALFGPKSGVRELTARNFKNEVLYNGNVTAVLFYAPWCGYCQGVAPEWQQAAKSLRGIARVAAVDCNEDANKALCAKYEIQGFPTIKVFQPAKLTDVDFKDVNEGKPLKRRRPMMYSYNGARDAKAITSYVVEKLRNYAASLDSDDALRWLAPNKVPRVVMLPGKKYKSKKISPLFKVLSREYFGKLRFAYIPRRVDGAWNLLGIPAPDESQLVYLSDDKTPIVYKGSMKKRDLKRFLDEQYDLEMYRRKHKGQSESAEREYAAVGLEFVTEDAQEQELEHVLERRAKEDVERRAAEAEHQAAFERYGKHAPSRKSSTSSTPTASATKIPDAEDAVVVEDDDFEVEPTENGGADGAGDDAVGEESEESGDDPELDEALIELTPEEIVQEGPEAVASYVSAQKAAQKAAQEAAQKTKGHASKSSAAPSPEGTGGANKAIECYDDFVLRCLRTGRNCAIFVSTKEQLKFDAIVLVRVLEQLNEKAKNSMLIDYMLSGVSDELDEFLDVIGLHNRPGLLFWDSGKQKMALFDEGWSQREVHAFLTAGMKRKLKNLDHKLPRKYLYWVTEAEVKAEAEAAEDVKDEL